MERGLGYNYVSCSNCENLIKLYIYKVLKHSLTTVINFPHNAPSSRREFFQSISKYGLIILILSELGLFSIGKKALVS